MIFIGLCSDDFYSPHMGVTMYSIMKNTPNPINLHFYVISDRITVENENKIRMICNQFGSKLSFVYPNKNSLNNLKICGHLGKQAYLRLLLPEMLPKKIKKIIYIDSDTVVEGNIREVYSSNINNKTIAAVPDLGAHFFSKKYLKTKGIENPIDYFNSGLLLINIERWIKKKITQKVINFTKEKVEDINFADQDGLNSALNNDWVKLPYEWNVSDIWFLKQKKLIKIIGQNIDKPKMIHYTSAVKPWKVRNLKNERDKYWKYLEKTPWNNEIVPAGKIKSFIEVNKRKLKLFIPFNIRLKIKKILK